MKPVPVPHPLHGLIFATTFHFAVEALAFLLPPFSFQLFFIALTMVGYLGEDWDILMSKMLKEFDTNESVESELTFAFSHLTQPVEKKAALCWHIKSFEDYNNENINPFGLRVQIFP